MTPNIEEWALLSCLAGAIVAEGDTYGVRIAKLIEGLCFQIVYGANSSGALRPVFNIEAMCRELQSLILDEAKSSASKKANKSGLKPEKYDFASVFNLFDEDGQGTISINEFQKMLSRLNIIDALPVEKVPELLRAFDPKKKGFVTLDGFIAFAMDKKYGNFAQEDGFDSEDDIDDDDDELPSSSNAPAAITQHAESDWLLWNIWKNALKNNEKDPERYINELEASCTEVEIESIQGAVSEKDLWFILAEMNLRENIGRQQFEAGLQHFAMDPKAKLSSGVDFESLCRGIVRMGRAYNALLQQRKKDESELYASLKKSLQNELGVLMEKDLDSKRYAFIKKYFYAFFHLYQYCC